MSSPQVPDATITPKAPVADLCTGIKRIAAPASPSGHVNRNRKLSVVVVLIRLTEDCLQYLYMKLLGNLHKEQRCRRMKDCFDIAMAEEKSPLRDWLRGLRLLQCYSRRRNKLNENDSHPSNADFAGAEQCIKEGKGKPSAAWVAATAAPHHATGNRELLSGFVVEHDGQFVHGVDGIQRKVLARGAVVTDSVVLPDVWFVPGLTENLVSVSQLVELDHSVGFSCGECCVSSTDGKVVGKGHLQEGGCYLLDFLKVPLAI